MITYNRLEYTKLALEALMHVGGGKIFIVDNCSTDGTQAWLKAQPWSISWDMTLLDENIGIAGAMNIFLSKTLDAKFVAKVDNDTIVPKDFLWKMRQHMLAADIVQAKHPLIKASGLGTFDEWTSTMRAEGPLRFNHFVGGSGILFKRHIVNHIPAVESKIGGWRAWQRMHPQYTKAFATDVEIKLLDTTEKGADYSKYPDYYKQTGRV